MKRTNCTWILSPLVAAIVALAAHASGQPKAPTTAPSGSASAASSSSAAPSAGTQAAGEHFDRGVELYRAGAFDAALAEFRRAHELVSSYAVLYNIGQTSYQLHDFAGALAAFEKYLSDGGKEVPAQRAAEVQKDMQRLRSLVATVDVQINEPGADVLFDEGFVGKAPLVGPLTVNPGRHKVSAQLPGRDTISSWVNVASKDAVGVRLEFPNPLARVPVASAAPATAPTSTQHPMQQPSGFASALPWIGWGVTGGLVVGTIVIGSLALKASSDLKQERESVPTSRQTLDDRSSTAGRWALAADILGGAALVAGGVSLYLTLSRPHPSEQPPSPQARVQVGPGWMGLGGTF
jgi:hypothetical protein